MHASRSTFIASDSALGAAQQVRDQILTAAADILGVPVEGLDLYGGKVTVGGDTLWQAMCAEWAKNCLPQEQAKEIAAILPCIATAWRGEISLARLGSVHDRTEEARVELVTRVKWALSAGSLGGLHGWVGESNSRTARPRTSV